GAVQPHDLAAHLVVVEHEADERIHCRELAAEAAISTAVRNRSVPRITTAARPTLPAQRPPVANLYTRPGGQLQPSEGTNRAHGRSRRRRTCRLPAARRGGFPLPDDSRIALPPARMAHRPG